MRAVLAALALLMILTAGRTSWAHARSVSYSTWTLTADGATVRLRVSRLDLSAARPEVLDDLGATLADGLQLIAAGKPCQRGMVQQLAADPAWRAFEWRTTCPSPAGRLQVQAELVFDAISSHLHFARVKDGVRDVELVLSDHRRTADVPPPAPAATSERAQRSPARARWLCSRPASRWATASPSRWRCSATPAPPEALSKRSSA